MQGTLTFDSACYREHVSTLTWCTLQVCTCSQSNVTNSTSRAFKPFSCRQPSSKLRQLQCRQSASSNRRPVATQCTAPTTQSPGRRVLGGVASAAFLTWALRSASAKSMKPGEVQKRSREEEAAIFENREGEVRDPVLRSPTSFRDWCTLLCKISHFWKC